MHNNCYINSIIISSHKYQKYFSFFLDNEVIISYECFFDFYLLISLRLYDYSENMIYQVFKKLFFIIEVVVNM